MYDIEDRIVDAGDAPGAPASTQAASTPSIGLHGTRNAAEWRSLDLPGRLGRHADLSLQILAHQISADYTTFFKRHVYPRVARLATVDVPRLNLREHSLLLALSQIPSGQSGVELAFLIRSDPATVSRNIKSLGRKGLVETQDNPADSRAHLYTLSRNGRTVADAYRMRWREAVKAADRMIGPMGDTAFRDQLSTFYTLKDRARAHALWTPGQPNAYETGMGRPEPAVRPDLEAVRVDVDSFFRFFGQQVSADYLTCMGRHLARPLLKTTDTGDGPLAMTDLRLMMCLDFHGECLSGADLARFMRFDPATVARSTAALERGGYVESRTNRDDRRRSDTCLTERGHALAERYRRRGAELARDVEAAYDLQWEEGMRARAITRVLATRKRARKLAQLRRLPH